MAGYGRVHNEEYIATLRVALLVNGRIPAKGYGGTERVVSWLAKGLAEAGHDVVVLASNGSSSPHARVLPLKLPGKEPRRFDYRPLLPSGVDVVHAHFPLYRQPDSVPLRWTLHGNARPGEVLPANGIALSADHARRHGVSRWVHNGLDPSEYRFEPTKGDGDLFLGRLHSIKGWRWAITGARRAGRRITIAGGWRPSLQTGVHFAGSVSGARKTDLLAKSACLWMPAQWDEPFGLTTIEAMVSGTPVLATRRGALPEIVTSTSGALGDTLDELVALRPGLDALDPEAVRARVIDAFTHRTMAVGYERLYREAIGRG